MTARRSPRAARRVLGWVLVAVGALAGLIILAALALVAVLVAQGKAPPSGNSEYVALGSSFAAGPGVMTRAPGSPLACLRSGYNYAHLLARQRHLNLTDMTCSGAVTKDILKGGQFFQGAQLAAVKPTTKLVTITVGGNDVSYLGNLFAWSCAGEPGKVPLTWKLLGLCRVRPPGTVRAAFSPLLKHMTEIARRVHAIAPGARIVYVDYTTVLPDRWVCPALPITPHEANTARTVAARLKKITAEAANSTGSILIQASTLTHGHDICSPHPWVFGFQLASNPLAFGPLPYHPTEQAMKVIARAINRDLSAR
jgi:lysophospholipase L1-like esterase